MSKVRDILGLCEVLDKSFVTHASNLDPESFNYHQAQHFDQRAEHIAEFDAITTGAGDGDSFYEVEFHATALYDRLEAFFAEKAKA